MPRPSSVSFPRRPTQPSVVLISVYPLRDPGRSRWVQGRVVPTGETTEGRRGVLHDRIRLSSRAPARKDLVD